MSQVVYLGAAGYAPSLLLWSGDWNGYMAKMMVTSLEPNELNLDGGRFALMAKEPCQYEVAYPEHDMGVMELSQYTETIINWCGKHCNAAWYIKFTKRDAEIFSPHKGHDVQVTFEEECDADLYAVMLKLDSSMLEPSV